MAKTRLHKAKNDIEARFDALDDPVLRRADIAAILRESRPSWRLSESLSLNAFISFMLQKSEMKRVVLKFPSRQETRYTWREVPLYAVALSLRRDSYFTHFTAMSQHHLTNQIPRTIYVNSEQPRKHSQDRSLEQTRIDRAFRSAPRTSNTLADIGDNRICLLNGMHTDQLGVIDALAPDGSRARVTDVERTLIDIAVRPFYAGGVSQVLKAYQTAAGMASVNKVAAFLKKLDYVYPYHQAIGFYLESSRAYGASAVALMEQFEIKYNFYLTHQMKDTDYSRRWRLYFPKGL